MSSKIDEIRSRYQILGTLREEGNRTLYRACRREDGDMRTVQLLQLHREVGAEAIANFELQAHALAGLRHPNVAQLFEFVPPENGRACLVLEHVAGVGLGAVMRQCGPPSRGLALEIARQILSALAFLHFQEISHRDLTPDHLVLSRDFSGVPLIKLLDPGLAGELVADEPWRGSNTLPDQLYYTSPELLVSAAGRAAPVGSHSDIYSCAAILYELLTGSPPFPGPDVATVVEGHLHRLPRAFGQSEREAAIPAPLRQAVFAALARHPNERTPDAARFEQQLAPFFEPPETLGDEIGELLLRVGQGRPGTVPPRRRATHPRRSGTSPPRRRTSGGTQPLGAATPPPAVGWRRNLMQGLATGAVALALIAAWYTDAGSRLSRIDLGGWLAEITAGKAADTPPAEPLPAEPTPATEPVPDEPTPAGETLAGETLAGEDAPTQPAAPVLDAAVPEPTAPPEPDVEPMPVAPWPEPASSLPVPTGILVLVSASHTELIGLLAWPSGNPIELGDRARAIPLRLTLPAGDYTATFTRPGSDQPFQLELTIGPGETSTLRIEDPPRGTGDGGTTDARDD